MGKLSGKVVLVTGASKGIGQGLAIGLAAAGAQVAVNYKTDTEGAQSTLASIREAGGEAAGFQADIGAKSEFEALVDAVCARFGRLDVLVNNAARTRFGHVFEITEEDFDDVVNTNLRGPFFGSVAAARKMQEQGSGSIINISSIAARLMIPAHSSYTMAKGGLEALTRQLALELAPEVRVNAIAPTATSTERNRGYDPDFDTEVERDHARRPPRLRRGLRRPVRLPGEQGRRDGHRPDYLRGRRLDAARLHPGYVQLRFLAGPGTRLSQRELCRQGQVCGGRPPAVKAAQLPHQAWAGREHRQRLGHVDDRPGPTDNVLRVRHFGANSVPEKAGWQRDAGVQGESVLQKRPGNRLPGCASNLHFRLCTSENATAAPRTRSRFGVLQITPPDNRTVCRGTGDCSTQPGHAREFPGQASTLPLLPG